MKKKYSTPQVSIEVIYAADSMCASYSKKDCVAFDDATDTTDANGDVWGYPYMSGGVLTYCQGWG